MYGVIKYKGIDLLGPKQQRSILIKRGLLGAISLILVFYAIKLINPSDVSAIYNCNIVIVAIFARLFLNEKFSLAHVVGLIFTIIGIIFISQPSFIFSKTSQITKNNLILTDADSLMNPNINNCVPIQVYQLDLSAKPAKTDFFKYLNWISTNNQTKVHHKFKKKYICQKEDDSTGKRVIGFSITIIAAILFSCVAILLKQLADEKVHFSLVLAYSCYFGIPLSAIISAIMIFTGLEKKDPNVYMDSSLIVVQSIFAVASSLCGIFSNALMSISLEYEEASKMTLFKSSDLFFVFILQYLILGIKLNMYSKIGALLIFLGILTIMAFRILDKRNDRLSSALLMNGMVMEQSLFKKILFFKF